MDVSWTSVGIKPEKVHDALVWLFERGNYQGMNENRRAMVLESWSHRSDSAHLLVDAVYFRFSQDEQALALLFKLTWG